MVATGKHPPVRALLLSLAALAITVAGAFWVPDAFPNYEMLLWLLTVVVILIALFLGISAERLRRRKRGGRDAASNTGFTDPGTGLPNRSHAMLHLEIEFSAAQRGRPLGIILLDLDNFKGYNARHGTIAGDEILRLMGEVLKQTTRRMNLTARYGDDEFIAVLGGCDDDGAIAFVHRFQQTLQKVMGQRAVPTISGGVATHQPSMKTHQDLLAAAHAALKQAKKEGRGRIRVHGRPINLPLALGGGEQAGEQPAADAQPIVMPQGRGRGRKALIVAEQAPVRALLARYLTDHGFTVAQVSNVVDGVQCLTIEYDLLFTDISLDEGIGAELVRAAKLRWPSVQVIGLINQSTGDLVIDALNAGVDRYLVTPLDLQKVRHHITDLLARRDRIVTSVLESRQLTLEFQARTDDAVKALRQREEDFRSVLGSVHEVIFRTDMEGAFTHLNDAWTSALGYGVDESIGRSAGEFAHEEDRAEFTAALRTLAAGDRKDARFELRLLTSTGEARWFALRATRLFDADSRVLGVSGTLEDVSARKRAEDALRRSEADSRGLLAALPDEVLRLSRAGLVLNYHGREPASDSERVGASLEQIFPSSVATALRGLIEQAVRSGEPQVYEYRVLQGDELQEFEVRIAAAGDDGVVAIVRNVTDRKSLEEQLRQSQKLEAIGRLAGGLAHDFNNLLTVVQGNAHLLQEEEPGSPAARDYVQQISVAAERGATLVRQLLAFGRRQLLQPTVINLNTVVESTRDMLARLIGENILLEVDLETDVGLIKADPGQIEQVLVNLAVNAREVLGDGGVLRITTRNGALAVHSGGEPQPDDTVILTVSDNGPGMDSQTRERVFEPFFTTKGMAQGAGLGLATVYGIVRQSGGAISVLSEPGRGTSFEIAFPRIDS